MKTDYFKDLRHTAGRYDFMLAFIAILALFAALNVHGYDASYVRELLVMLLLLSLVVIRLFSGYRADISIPRHAVLRWWLVFCGWCAMSLLWTAVKGFTLLVALTMLTAPLSLLLAFWANERQWQSFNRLLLCLALLVVGVTGFQAFVLHIDRPSGFFLNWNTNSAFIGAILLPWCAVYMRHITHQKSALGLGFFMFGCAFAMALGQGRASLLSLLLGLSILFGCHRGQARAGIGMVGVLVWVLGGYAVGDLLHGGMLAERLAAVGSAIMPEAGVDVGSLGSGREHLWAAGWRMYLDRPWLGWGLGLYHMLYPQYRPALNMEDGNFAHNDYLQFLLELGPLGLLLCLAWVSALLMQSWRLYRSSELGDQRFVDLGLGLACAALLLHAFVDFHLYQSPMLILLGAYTGRLCRRVSQREPATCKQWRPQAHCTAAGYFSIVAGISLFFALAGFNISMAYGTAQDFQNSDDLPQVFAKLERAEQFLPWAEHFKSLKGQLIISMLKTEPDKVTAKERQLMTDFALSQLDQAIELNPLNTHVLLYKAELLRLLPDKQAEIEQLLRQALRIDPYLLDTRLKLADHLRQHGDTRQADRVLADGLNKAYAIESPPTVIAYWQAVDKALEQSSDRQAQRQVVREQMHGFSASAAFTSGKRVLMTLPDIGWKP